MRIVVASAEESIRSSIGMLISAQSDFELVGEVTDLADLLAQSKAQQPELVVVDWDAYGQRIETLLDLIELLDDPPTIVALSVDEEARAAALASGASGFAYMGDPPTRLLEAIRLSSRGSERTVSHVNRSDDDLQGTQANP